MGPTMFAVNLDYSCSGFCYRFFDATIGPEYGIIDCQFVPEIFPSGVNLHVHPH